MSVRPRRRRALLPLLAAALVLLAPLFATPADVAEPPATAPAADAPSFRAGRIDAAEIAECSALVASRRHPGVFWTLCDSGNAPVLYAITRAGKLLAAFPVAARNVDWEDLAIDDDGHLYLAETGNNARRRRPMVVYRVDEPDPAKPPAPGHPSLRVGAIWRRDFPAPADCEALFVHAGRGYLIPKVLNQENVGLYAFGLAGGPGPAPLERVARLPVGSPVTAADVSPDGRWLAVMTVTGPHLFRIDGDPARAGRVEPKSVLYISPKMEACALVEDGLLAATEDRDVFLFRWKDFAVDPGAAGRE